MPTVTIGDNTTDDFAGTEDTWLRQADPTGNYGTNTTGEVTKFAAGNHSHILIAFSGLGNIAGPVAVSAATLYLWKTSGHLYNIEAKKVIRNWVEGEASWNIWKAANNWSTGGGIHEEDDRSATPTFDVSSLNVGTPQYVACSSAQLAADVEAFINGSLPNYGWHIARSDAGEDSKFNIYALSDHATDENRPYLSVTYEAVSGGRIPKVIHGPMGGPLRGVIG